MLDAPGFDNQMTDRSRERVNEGSRGPKRVLVFAYYFPPMGLSGVQRTLKFAKYLSRFGWLPTVLTCEPRGYFAYDESLLEELEQSPIRVQRTTTWDPTRLFGKSRTVRLPAEPKRRLLAAISQFIFVPDNKIGWWWPARRRAAQLLSEERFDLVFSTAPPYSAHLIAGRVARAAGLPLVLDFRDDWIGNPRHTYPTPLHESLSAVLERSALKSASRIVVINDVIRNSLLIRNANIVEPEDVVIVPQGFDPADFDRPRQDRSAPVAVSPTDDPGVFRVLYSGVFYDAQTPEPFLRALADLVNRRPQLKPKIEAMFVGLLPEKAVQLSSELGIGPMIRHTGYLPHDQAVAHITSADLLWMMVGRTEGAESISTSKMYEYFGARKPILGIVPDGAAKSELLRYGAAEIADPDAVSEISAALERLYNAWSSNQLPQPREAFVRRFDRIELTEKLARIFDTAVREVRPPHTKQLSSVDA